MFSPQKEMHTYEGMEVLANASLIPFCNIYKCIKPTGCRMKEPSKW